jgi:hypothetical protein
VEKDRLIMQSEQPITPEEAMRRDEAPNLTSEERHKICQSCDRNFMGACRECGCITALKVLWKSQSCPIGKWGSIN